MNPALHELPRRHTIRERVTVLAFRALDAVVKFISDTAYWLVSHEVRR